MARSQVLQMAGKRERHQEITVHKTTKDGPNQMASNVFLDSQKMLVERGASAELRAALKSFYRHSGIWGAQTSSRKRCWETPGGISHPRSAKLLPILTASVAVNAHCEGNLPATLAKAG